MENDQPSVIIVRDDEGNAHWTSPNSPLAKKYAKPEVEVPDAPEPPAASDDLDTRTADTGPGERKRATRSTGGAVRGSSTPEPEPGS